MTGKKHRFSSYSRVLDRFRKAGKEQGWWTGEGSVVAAVSGGSDSMAMLWLLRFFWGGRVFVAHLDHGFRQETALRDAEFVEQICHEWQIECRIEHLHIPTMRRKGETLEEAGRRERYGFLRRAASDFGATFIATGHTANDSAETVFLNLLRGTGIRGLRGIPGAREEIVRPVISCFRTELQDFLRERSVPWVTDESNEETCYFRNRIRNVIFPSLCREGNPRFVEHLIGLSSDLSDLERMREDRARHVASWTRTEQPLALRAWRTGSLLAMDEWLVRSLFAYEGRDLGLSPLSRSKTDSLLGLVSGGSGPWRFQWEKDMELCGSRGLISLVPRGIFTNDGPPSASIRIDGDRGSFSWGKWEFLWEMVENPTTFLGEAACTVPIAGSRLLELESVATSGEKDGNVRKIPWWAEKEWPLVRSAGLSWIPFSGRYTGRNSVEEGQALRLKARCLARIMRGESGDVLRTRGSHAQKANYPGEGQGTCL